MCMSGQVGGERIGWGVCVTLGNLPTTVPRVVEPLVMEDGGSEEDRYTDKVFG